MSDILARLQYEYGKGGWPILNDAAAVTVKVTSKNPAVAVPVGAVNGVLTLNFAAGAPNTQSIQINPIGFGSTTFEFASTP